MTKFEVTIEGTDVAKLPVHMDASPYGQPADVIRLGDGTLLVLVGKYMDGREAHYRYNIARVHELPNVFAERKEGQ